jgi:hypothetical protein
LHSCFLFFLFSFSHFFSPFPSCFVLRSFLHPPFVIHHCFLLLYFLIDFPFILFASFPTLSSPTRLFVFVLTITVVHSRV